MNAIPTTPIRAGDMNKAIGTLLFSIPLKRLAEAALSINALARALMYYETHLRSKYKGGLNVAGSAPQQQYARVDVEKLREI